VINTWELPTSLEISGVFWKIRTDFRAILDILKCMSDTNYEDDEKWLICLMILYEDFDDIPKKSYKEACLKAREFIEMQELKETAKNAPVLMDWEQDANLIIPAVNRVIGHEIRLDSYMHWWTFLGAYMEIGECSFSHILSLRSKRAKGKKLEKWEQEFISENKDIVNLKRKLTDSEREEEAKEQEVLSQFF
jgi:hypothetical protein